MSDQREPIWLDFKTAQKRVALALIRCPQCGAPAGTNCNSANYTKAPNGTHNKRVRLLNILYSFRAKEPNEDSTSPQGLSEALALV